MTFGNQKQPQKPETLESVRKYEQTLEKQLRRNRFALTAETLSSVALMSTPLATHQSPLVALAGFTLGYIGFVPVVIRFANQLDLREKLLETRRNRLEKTFKLHS